MTPGGRISAAIAVLDQVLAGEAAERALTNWGRASRFAGSADRAAVRDLAFGAIRCKRSFAALGGAETGRGLMIGSLRAAGQEPEAAFDGVGHAPGPIGPADPPGWPPIGLEALDCPDWLGPQLQASLGADFAAVMRLLQRRAPVFLRVNLRRGSVQQAIERLASDAITAVPHPLAATALEVTANARKVQTSDAYGGGFVELQDAGSQAVLEALPLAGSVLDYCAGGGGKALALAACGAEVWAHDLEPRRMRDIPVRAKRAGVTIRVLEQVERRFDLVLLDVPCSGSGSWRRAPDGKWALTQARLEELVRTQAQILDLASGYVAPQGHLAYVTCSVLDAENSQQISAFLGRNRAWRLVSERRQTPLDGGDGFFATLLTRY